MRNLVQYPIEPEEVIECLTNRIDELTETKSIGDMRPLLLQTAVEVVKKAYELQQAGSPIFAEAFNSQNVKDVSKGG